MSGAGKMTLELAGLLAVAVSVWLAASWLSGLVMEPVNVWAAVLGGATLYAVRWWMRRA